MWSQKHSASILTWQYIDSMNLEQLRHYCLSKADTKETLPFGPDTVVYTVRDKAFALTGLDSERPRVNLKCDPDYAVELREQYTGIIPGWHMNKKHWNTVYLDEDVKDKIIRELIDHSYDMVLAKMPKPKKK